MAWWVLHEMKEQDLRAILLFIKNLGPKGVNAPPIFTSESETKTSLF